MAQLEDLKNNRTPFKEKPLPQAHFLERHFIHPKASWDEAARIVAGMFPRDTRAERPKPWYRLLAGTHWPGQVPPGNGPFYVPEWVFADESLDALKARFKKEGFKEAVAHVVVLPMDGEYLAAAMRAAEQNAWNVNPRTYRAYLYPTLGSKKRVLRRYNVERLRM